MEFADFKLLNNPFRISPSMNPEELIWVGMNKLQKKLDDRINLSIKTSPSNIIINWGIYGSGKTHAANYYTFTDHISSTFNCETKNIRVNLPRGSKDPVLLFLRALIGQLNFNTLYEDFQKLKTEYQGDTLKIIEKNTPDSIIADFIKKFLNQDNSLSNSLFPEMEANAPIDAMKSFLVGDTSKSVLNKLNMPLGLNDDEQIVNLLSGIFNSISFEKKIYKAIFLWIDEFEDIVTLPKSTQERFTTFLRQLLDKTPNNLHIFLNFTLKGFDQCEDLSIVLGEALASRAKIRIDFEEPSIEEAINYVTEHLNHPNFREKNHIDAANPYYPFNEQSITFVIENIGRRSLRTINETFSLLIELGLIHSKTLITKEFISEIRDEVPTLN